MAELMRRELEISAATANGSGSGRRGPLEGNRGPFPLVIAAPDSQQSKRPHENRQTNVARRASLNGPVGAATQRDRPSDLLAIEA